MNIYIYMYIYIYIYRHNRRNITHVDNFYSPKLLKVIFPVQKKISFEVRKQVSKSFIYGNLGF